MTTPTTNTPPARNDGAAQAATPPRALTLEAIEEIFKFTPSPSGISAGHKAKVYIATDTHVKNYCANKNYTYDKDWRQMIPPNKTRTWNTWRGKNGAAVEAAKVNFNKPKKTKVEVKSDSDDEGLDADQFVFGTQATNVPAAKAAETQYSKEEIVVTHLYDITRQNPEKMEGFDKMATAAEGTPATILAQFTSVNEKQSKLLESAALEAHKKKPLDIDGCYKYLLRLVKNAPSGPSTVGSLDAEVAHILHRLQQRFPEEMKHLTLDPGAHGKLLRASVAAGLQEESKIPEAKTTDVYQVKLKKVREALFFTAGQVVGLASTGINLCTYAGFFLTLSTTSSIVDGPDRRRALYSRIKSKFRHASDALCLQAASLITTGLVRAELACDLREKQFEEFGVALHPDNLAKPHSLEKLTQDFGCAGATFIKILITCGCLFDNNGRFAFRDNYDRISLPDEFQMWYLMIENFVGERPNQDGRHFAQDALKEDGFIVNTEKRQYAPAVADIFAWTVVAGKTDRYGWRQNPKIVALHLKEQERRMGAGREDDALSVFDIGTGRRDREDDAVNKGPNKPSNDANRNDKVWCSYHRTWGTHTVEHCIQKKRADAAKLQQNKKTHSTEGAHSKAAPRNGKVGKKAKQ